MKTLKFVLVVLCYIYFASTTTELWDGIISTETVSPQLLPSTKNETRTHFPQKVTLFMNTNKGLFVFWLQLNSQLISKNFSLAWENSTYVVLPMCYYQAKVNTYQHFHAMFSLCYGIHGVFEYEENNYYIRPKNVTNHASLENIGREHLLTTISSSSDLHCNSRMTRRKPINNRPRKDAWHGTNVIQAVKFLELYLVNDVSVYNFYGHNMTYIEDRCKLIANILDAKYRHLRIRIILVGVEIWTEKDLIKVSGNSHQTLLNFMTYRRDHINKRIRNDNTQFITKRPLDNGRTAGKAPIGTICSEKYSAGINHDSHTNPSLISNIIAHELGHNLGMRHDHNQGECWCSDHKKFRCIMNHQLDGNVKSFSACSRHHFERLLQEGHGSCLFDFPTNIKQPSICGNGIIEKDEECDCGHRENCAKYGNCCHPNTCKLYKNATCASGECCYQCRFKPRRSLCREQRGECDLAEYCTGHAGNCPNDVHVQDTHSCRKGNGYCTTGVCMTHHHQCQELFGNDSISADGFCYKEFNIQGIASGHCGQNSSGYKACKFKDAYCGKMQCVPNTKPSSLYMENKIRWTTLGITKKCVSKGYPTYTHANDGDLGLAKDGTRCGTDSICLNNKCIPASQYRLETELKLCPRNCSGRGVCNSKNNCHCYRGWNPPYCDKPGNGGSIDSGPPSPHERDDDLVIARPFYIILTLIFVTLLIVVLVFSRSLIRNVRKKHKEKQQANLKLNNEELKDLLENK